MALVGLLYGHPLVTNAVLISKKVSTIYVNQSKDYFITVN